MAKEKCADCKFFKPEVTIPNGGFCRRYPPAISWTQTAQGQIVPAGSSFVPTLNNYWCGEFEIQLVKPTASMPKGMSKN